jgi:hypothetical protein
MGDSASGKRIELDQHMEIQKVIWGAQRFAWAVAALVMLLVALGMTGSGPLGDATGSDDAGLLAVDYSRFARSVRQAQGLKRMDQIKYAVLERSGQISFVPWYRE